MAKLPHFVIAGAMKSGTTTLQYILNTHKKIYLPQNEVYFFDLDDIKRHPYFFNKVGKQWAFHDFEQNFDIYFRWYKSFFQDAGSDQIIGECSTSYFSSGKAPLRIKEHLPNAKIIIMLRDPVYRAYSHYWHLVRTGRTYFNFDKAIQFMPDQILHRGFYKEQLERYFQYFSKDRVKIVIFEEFIEDMQAVIDDICTFLSLGETIDLQDINTHQNPARIPVLLGLQLKYNQLFKSAAIRKQEQYLPLSIRRKNTLMSIFLTGMLKKYLKVLPPASKSYEKLKAFIEDRKNQIFLTDFFELVTRKVNFTTRATPPSMRPETKLFLRKLYNKENKGLEDMLNKPLHALWDK